MHKHNKAGMTPANLAATDRLVDAHIADLMEANLTGKISKSTALLIKYELEGLRRAVHLLVEEVNELKPKKRAHTLFK